METTPPRFIGRPSPFRSVTAATLSALAIMALESPRAVFAQWQINPQKVSAAALSPSTPLPAGSGAQSSNPPTGGTSTGSPALTNAQLGININENSILNLGSGNIPPDPNGAVGPNHLVVVVNSAIRWQRISDAFVENSQRLGPQSGNSTGAFFAPLFTTTTVAQVFDPHVIFDQHNQRFIVVALDASDPAQNTVDNRSRILVSVSDDADPNGAWFYGAINSRVSISRVENGSTVTYDTFADFPGIGVDAAALYITVNQAPFGTDKTVASRLHIVDKAQLYGNQPIQFITYNPSSPFSAGEAALTFQPAHVYGAASVANAEGTFLLTTALTATANGNSALGLIRINNPIPSAGETTTFTAQGIDLGGAISLGGDHAGAPQLGSARLIATGDNRASNAVWRGSRLYTSNTITPPAPTPPATDPDAGQATVHWYSVNTSGATWTLEQQGSVGGESIAPGTRTFFPAIMVDSVGNVGLSFSASASTIYPGSYYIGRLAADAVGMMRPPGAFAPGQDFISATTGLTTPLRKTGGAIIRRSPSTPKTSPPFGRLASILFHEAPQSELRALRCAMVFGAPRGERFRCAITV